MIAKLEKNSKLVDIYTKLNELIEEVNKLTQAVENLKRPAKYEE